MLEVHIEGKVSFSPMAGSTDRIAEGFQEVLKNVCGSDFKVTVKETKNPYSKEELKHYEAVPSGVQEMQKQNAKNKIFQS